MNAGSNTVSVFAVHGDRLRLRQVIDSGGTFPVSVAVHDDLVYVLNARERRLGAGLPGAGRPPVAIRAARPGRSAWIPSDTPQFTHTPGQVAFSPDGSQLVVTTKANGNDIDVFGVGRWRAPLVHPGGQRRARHRALRDHLRPRATSSSPRRAPTRWPHSARPGRDGDPDRLRWNRAGGHLLGRPAGGTSSPPTPAARTRAAIA